MREQLPSGKVRVRVVVNGVRKTLGTFASDAEAARIERAHQRNLAEGVVGRPDGQTLRSFGRAWLEDRELRGNKRGRKVKDLDSERSLWVTHIESAVFADWPVESLRTFDVEEHVRELAGREAVQTIRTTAGIVFRPSGRTLSASTIKHALRVLRQVLDGAVARDIVPRNVAAGVAAPHEGEGEQCWSWLSIEEIALIERNVPEPYRTPLLFAIYMGPRQMELWRLQRGDIDLEGGWLTVREGADGSTKSGKVRKAPLLPQARALVEAWLERTPGAEPATVLFTKPDGERFGHGYDGGWDDKRKRRPLAEVARIRADEQAGKLRIVEIEPRAGTVLVETHGWRTKAGIARTLRFHDLRHTCASHLVQGTWGRQWRLEEVRSFLGHSSISVTQRYAHLSPEGLLKAARETPGAPGPCPRRAHGPRKSAPRKAAHPLVKQGARPPRIDRGTGGLEGRCSIQLSYGRGARTSDARGGLVGETGFEPATSSSQSWRTTRLCYSPKEARLLPLAAPGLKESGDFVDKF